LYFLANFKIGLFIESQIQIKEPGIQVDAGLSIIEIRDDNDALDSGKQKNPKSKN
jgi:hypothetical protein